MINITNAMPYRTSPPSLLYPEAMPPSLYHQCRRWFSHWYPEGFLKRYSWWYSSASHHGPAGRICVTIFLPVDTWLQNIDQSKDGWSTRTDRVEVLLLHFFCDALRDLLLLRGVVEDGGAVLWGRVRKECEQGNRLSDTVSLRPRKMT